jgi:hypothetical protein
MTAAVMMAAVAAVRPTSKYVPKWWDKSPNKQLFFPKLWCTLSHN